ncbi:MAG: GNAT family N-acetyltransferase [Clostridia bacterium]|nr:GNAT family N-acetyltransferase [Clostridia bacterium]
MTIRTATMKDLDQIAGVEQICFPPEEAAKRETFRERLWYYANHFLLMLDGERLISFVDGLVTNEPDLTDEMMADARMHDEQGKWQMIFGVNTLPEFRRKGYASSLLREVIERARTEGRRGLVLTCKDAKVPFYARLGFTDEGRTDKSSHGGAVWHQMRLTFESAAI